MGEPDLFISTENAIEVDRETEAAIERGIRDIEEGRVFSQEEVRVLLPEWKKKYGPTES